MSNCNEINQDDLGHHLIMQSIRLYFAYIGFQEGPDDDAVLNRSRDRMYQLIDLVPETVVRNAMHGQLEYSFSQQRSERTFHTSWANMQWDMFEWYYSKDRNSEVLSLLNFYLQPMFKQGTDTTRILYLRFLGKLCVLMGGMSYPNFSAFQDLLDQGATGQEHYPQQGFIFSLVGFMNTVSNPLPNRELQSDINNANPQDWDFEPNSTVSEIFFNNLGQAFNPIPGVCE